MRTLVRIRILLARRPLLVWALVLIPSLGAAVAVHREIGAARRERARWGEATDVLVATAPVAAGTPVASARLVSRHLPAAAVPADALGHAAADAVVARPLVAGEVLVRADLAGDDPRFALAPPGQVVVALPRPPVLVPLVAGDRIEVTTTGGQDEPITRTAAVVVAVSDASVLVAVAPNDAAPLAAAAVRATDPPGFVLLAPGARVAPP